MGQVEAPDTDAVVADRGTYSTRKANPDDSKCSCFGVPDGQHSGDCIRSKTPDASTCPGCGFRTATIVVEGEEPAMVCGTTKRTITTRRAPA